MEGFMTLTTMLLVGVVIAFPGRRRPSRRDPSREDPPRDPRDEDAWRREFLEAGGCLLPAPMILPEEDESE
jgi:hypothetical protein